jgi:hypothetical protein
VLFPLLVFATTLGHGFVWDDDYNFVSNRDYRGLDWSHLVWMFRAAHHAHWTPITWMTLGLDYVVWGMRAGGYHLTNILLHAVNAWLLYRVALRLLSAARPASDPRPIAAGAVAASLFFSLHPLRVESVAWITERRDLVAGCFFLLTVLLYLQAHVASGRAVGRWRLASLVCFQLAILSKATVVGLPIALLVLDVYPLKRLPGSPMRWLTSRNRPVLAEKLPYLVLAIFGSIVTAAVFGSRGYLSTLDTLPLLTRPAIVAHGVGFYLWKTLVPLELSPLYEMPTHLSVLTPRFLAPLVGGLITTAVVFALRARWPAALAAWVAYIVILAPVSGAVHQGAHLVADRNTYLACMPFALLFGGVVFTLTDRGLAGRITRPAARLALSVIVVWLVTLAALTAHQTSIWRDAATLWRHAVARDSDCFRCQHNLGLALVREGHVGSGIVHLERAARLRPGAAAPRGALVIAYLTAGEPEKAAAQLAVLRSLDRELATQLDALFLTAW